MKAPCPEHPEVAWQSFVLHPFQPEGEPAGPIVSGPAGPGTGLELTGQIRRRAGTLELAMRLVGDLASVVLAAPSSRPERRDDLWRSTCFELFIAAAGEPVYREVNLSPTGHWNVYRFSSYRQGMENEPCLQALPFEFKSVPGSIELALAWPLPDDLRAAKACLEVGVCAVIEQRQGQLSYWALTHPGDEADFHRRDGLLLRL
ncbi:DOMON-like domain-containing protein [Synechococcus sp. Cruz-9H2]|uniref:DOMON-like domain-containing protein n=1 Tax=unclassified Synechococcus TaxID=2626047 RepID=UPI0020CD27A6|nr:MULTISPECIES: DOMON-like domain-containing protein [unclassified Synechococcus]MCP9817976.1 DOMON-like domain-containing protein [Synechococcus sp. Cruz-9H2]MCP9842524.1 DOMON-like domain-containing protein [Synechococcus sp. Edmonson 11F2]MCP9854372.1 DOMON-like domain-containing protein [Synechococcus sp. Cruz-9C9]MCP9861932.1 DOMON-like domain-containing protein [Synechococcus sp. Cruz-7E5]MCP9868884.1 DOMON-like domain-containing protein [Synechococcus sp. Cruz-7B9]